MTNKRTKELPTSHLSLLLPPLIIFFGSILSLIYSESWIWILSWGLVVGSLTLSLRHFIHHNANRAENAYTLDLREGLLHNSEKKEALYRKRFISDITRVSRLAIEKTGRPLWSMLITQNSANATPLFDLMEKQIQHSEAHLIPSGPYRERFDGKTQSVSQWEGHPNEYAHQIYAETILHALNKKITFSKSNELP